MKEEFYHPKQKTKFELNSINFEILQFNFTRCHIHPKIDGFIKFMAKQLDV